VNQRLRVEDVDSPLCDIRPVKSVLLVVLSGDRGLCGGYNNFIIKKVGLIMCYAVDLIAL
jgi:F-type H+-transporting ATPase subunit gamma